ncbi:class III lanthionine synthetase LanKC N-terminal domain-containing protein [Rhodococcoides fascians]|uniref:class III lanthionine synthetase LanKC N-terminal domain-containing protein n=1 Tax=Rhodococcoides fascians TaxID=1828 RepID=UPI00050C6659|nr:protein kinase/lanthionine synthetase C family protein [Rhodococcus fascians]
MGVDWGFFALGHEHFFAPPWTEGSPWLRGLFPDPAVPPQWTSSDSGPWRSHCPAAPLAPSGWKVHISAHPDQAAAAIGLAARVCVDQGVAFKHLRSSGLVHALQMKFAPTAHSGKVVACYPEPDALEDLCLALVDALDGIEGPDIVGEPRIGTSSVHLRFGAFVGEWLATGDGVVPAMRRGGELEHDRRGSAGESPPHPYADAVAAAHRRTLTAATLPLRDARLIHRTNAGGVYRGTWDDGRAVIVKEARHRAGLDLDGIAAPIRLAQEHIALQRLSGKGVAPEPIWYGTIGPSDFLAMQDVGVGTLVHHEARRHPAVIPGLDVEDSGYVAWIGNVLAAVRRALDIMHAAGVAHGDVHPANVVLQEDGSATMIDFESCAVDGVSCSRGIVAAGYSNGEPPTPQGDRDSVKNIADSLLHPAAANATSASVRADMVAGARADLDLAPHLDRLPVPTTGALVDGICGAAQFDAFDALFPVDHRRFHVLGAGLSLLWGTAGVLVQLKRCGTDHVFLDAGVQWLAQAALAAQELPSGFGDGGHGIAWALGELGDVVSAERVLDRLNDGRPDPPGPWWRNGSAGIALAYAHIARATRRDDLRDRALELTDSLPTSGSRPVDHIPGIGFGGAGVACAADTLGRLLDGDTAAVSAAALDWDLRSCEQRASGLYGRQNSVLLPYLGRGSGGVAVAARLCGIELDADVVAGLSAASATPIVAFGGLYEGRAGLAVAAHAVSTGEHPYLPELTRRLCWSVGNVDGNSMFRGDQNARYTTDLATGSAGALIALAQDPVAAFASSCGFST